MLGQSNENRSRKSKSGFGQCAAFVACIIVPLAVLLSAGCGRIENLASAERARGLSLPSVEDSGLAFSTATIDLGFLAPGGRSEQIVTLSNTCDTPLTVAKLRTSCECLVAQCEQKEIGPAESVPVLVRIDLSDDPGFVGSLLANIEAMDRSGQLMASVGVAVTIDPIAKWFATN